jgi:hypothetical protein
MTVHLGMRLLVAVAVAVAVGWPSGAVAAPCAPGDDR